MQLQFWKIFSENLIIHKKIQFSETRPANFFGEKQLFFQKQ